jgi:uncharacterized protein
MTDFILFNNKMQVEYYNHKLDYRTIFLFCCSNYKFFIYLNMEKKEIIQIIKDLKEELVDNYHISLIALFGSYATGNFKEDSDIDILVDFKTTPGLIKFYSLNDFLESALQNKVDLITINSLHKSLRTNILNEAIYL